MLFINKQGIEFLKYSIFHFYFVKYANKTDKLKINSNTATYVKNYCFVRLKYEIKLF